MKTKAMKIIKALIIINAVFLFLSVPLSIVFGDELGWQEKWYTKMNILLGISLFFLYAATLYLEIKKH